MSPKNNKKNNKGLGDEIVREIRKNDIKMKPPCYFTVISLFWLGLGAIIFLISLVLLGFGVHYFNEYEFIGLIGKGYLSGWFLAPLVIMVFSVLLLYLSSRFYRKGRICCRHEEWMLLLAIGIVAILGLFALARSDLFKGWRDSIEDRCGEKGVVVSAEKFWSNWDEGRVFGEIEEMNQEGGYLLINYEEGRLLRIDTNGCDCKINHKNAKKGDCIKLIGEFENEEFRAKEIWSWD